MQAQKKRDTFASAYRGVWRTLKSRMVKAHAQSRDFSHNSRSLSQIAKLSIGQNIANGLNM